MIFGIRNWVRTVGILLITCGAICIPKGAGTHPYYFTLTFSYLAESGALFRTGLVLLAFGVVLIIVSLIGDPLRRRSHDDYYW